MSHACGLPNFCVKPRGIDAGWVKFAQTLGGSSQTRLKRWRRCLCCQLQPANEDPPIDSVCLTHPTIDEFLGNPQVPHPGFDHIGHFSLPRGRSAALYHEPVVLRLNLLFHSLRSAPPVRGDTLKRLPLYSLASGVIVAIVLMVVAVSGAPIPNIGLGALGLLPLAAALVDAVRLKTIGEINPR